MGVCVCFFFSFFQGGGVILKISSAPGRFICSVGLQQIEALQLICVNLHQQLSDALRLRKGRLYMEVVGCKAKESSCTLRPAAMLFHGISGDHIQGIMEEMERRSKTESRLAKGVQMNGRETVRFKALFIND